MTLEERFPTMSPLGRRVMQAKFTRAERAVAGNRHAVRLWTKMINAIVCRLTTETVY